MLDRSKFSKEVLELIDLGLSDNPAYGDISGYPNLEKLDFTQCNFLSLGLSNIPEYGDISSYPDLDKLNTAQCVFLSFGLSNDTMYNDISYTPELWLLSNEEVIALSENNTKKSETDILITEVKVPTTYNALASVKKYIDKVITDRKNNIIKREDLRVLEKKRYAQLHTNIVSRANKEQTILTLLHLKSFSNAGLKGVVNDAINSLNKINVSFNELVKEYESYVHKALLKDLNSNIVFLGDSVDVDYFKYGNVVHRDKYIKLDHEADYRSNALCAFITHEKIVSIYNCDHNSGYYAKLKEVINDYSEMLSTMRSVAKKNSLLTKPVETKMIFCHGHKSNLFEKVMFL